MKDKTILFVCQFFYPEKVSSGILPFELAKGLSERGYKVKALVGYPKEYCDEKSIKRQEEISGVKVQRIKYATFKRSSFIGRILNYVTFCLSVLFHFSYFKNIDICISYTNPPLLPPLIAWFSNIFGFRYLFEIYDLYPDTAIKAGILKEKSLIVKIFNKGTNYALKKAWKIIALSSECKKYLVQNKNITEDKICIIPNWYEASKLNKKEKQHDKITIIYGGNMGIMQDIDTIKNLLISMKNNMNFKFIFAGHGNKRHVLEETVIKYNISNCEMYDFLPKKEYDKLLNQADMAIVSLEKFGVGLGVPSKLYGYLSKGIPVIAIIDEDTEIVKDMSEYRYGIHCMNGDYEGLRSTLYKLLDNQEELICMGENAYRLYESKYTLQMATEKFVTLIEESDE